MKHFSPSMLISFVDSPYGAWYDRAFKENPEKYKDLKDSEDPLQNILQAKGYEHEDKVLKEFERLGKSILKNPKDMGEISDAINRGIDVIFQAKLITEHFSGNADFIVKENDEYIIYDTKLSRTAKPYMIYQLCIYSEGLSLITGKMPEYFKIITGNNEKVRKNINDYFDYYKQIEQDFLKFHNNFDIDSPPNPEDFRSYGNWGELAYEQLKKKDHLSLIANITKKQIIKLNDAKIFTIDDLVKLTDLRKIKIESETLKKLQLQASLQKQSEKLEVPKYQIIKKINIPPITDEDLYFDMEGYPLFGKNGLEYLFGATLPDKKFVDFWAHDEKEEKKAFCDFIDFAFKRFIKNPKMKIYHYASYEVSAMKKLSTLHGVKEHEVDTFLRNDVFIDLFKVVKETLMVGGENYSIKTIEKLYRPKRKTDVVTAGDSVIAYANWIASGESKNYSESKLLNDIRDYNRDDCDSTLELANWLRSKMEQDYEKKSSEVIIDEDTKTSDIEELRQELLLKNPDDPIFENLTYLLDFNKRKDKPLWWRYFEFPLLSKEELEEDLNCISELKLVKIEKDIFLYKYDPSEDTKIKNGEKCIDVNQIKITIEEINHSLGEVKLKLPQIWHKKPPKILSIMIHNYINTKNLDARIKDFVENYYEEPDRFLALRDFFNRARPKLSKTKSPLVKEKAVRTEEALKILDTLDKTTFCIQGPPGTGKTYTAKHMIASALKNKKKVGIMSNSHKAIDHLLNEACAFIDFKFKGLRVHNNPTEIYDLRIEVKKETLPLLKYDLIAGTVFALAKCKEEEIDYLFIDEAGQVSLANLIAAGISAKNIILMGDQQQLPQPIEGSHPKETGLSLLEYYMQDKATIDNDQGLFLDITYRCHSDISGFISKHVYDNRLITNKDTNKRIVQKLKSNEHESGIVYVPVEHSKNTQSSEEEIDEIIKLTENLLKRNKTDLLGEKIGKIGFSDILYVAPYNLQVSRISERLSEHFKVDQSLFKVGSVDKFQGQEAPVVIISMCTSSNETIGSRGIDFLFSMNRLNVAITRAQSIAYLVASTGLLNVRTQNLEHMKLLNFWCSLVKFAKKI